MIQYHMHSNNYLEVCRAYRSLYESEGVTETEDKWTAVRGGTGRGGAGKSEDRGREC